MGKLTKEHIEIARKNGICKSTVKTRVNDLDWDIEKAITYPVRSKNGISNTLKGTVGNRTDWIDHYKKQYLNKINNLEDEK